MGLEEFRVFSRSNNQSTVVPNRIIVIHWESVGRIVDVNVIIIETRKSKR